MSLTHSPIGFHHASLIPRLALIPSASDGFEVRFKHPISNQGFIE